jgi:hypothetical protein
MAWTYDSADLDNTTSAGRLNIVRLLVGDVNEDDPQLQDEEVSFSLSETGNYYYAAAYCCRLLASKYARMVNTQLDGALEAEYSDRIKNYNLLALQMNDFAKKFGGKGLGVSAGGIKISEMELANQDTNRVKPIFNSGQFKSPYAGNRYISDYD